MQFRSPLAHQLFAGQYKEILRATIDSAASTHEPSDTPIVIAALVFSGRQDEALAIRRWWQKEHGDDALVAVASHFFLAIGACRIGQYTSAIGHCREAQRAAERSDALHGFFVHQAIGLVRHFTGRIRSAVRHAQAARRLATEARFAYGRMLAMDLLGHGLVAKGEIHAGISILEQSAELAGSLGLAANAGAPRTTQAVLRVRYGICETDPRKELTERMAALDPEDGYSRRMVLSEIAMQHAYAGEGAAAKEAIEAAARIPLPDGDRRARIRKLLAESIVVGLSHGPSAAEAKLEAAHALLDLELDAALEVELLWARAVAEGFDAVAHDPRVHELARLTGSSRAVVLATPREDRKKLELLAEDRLAALLESIQRDPEEARHRVTTEGLWGFLPALTRRSPARRIHLLHDLALMVVEDHGQLMPLEMPGAMLVSLLSAFASGPMAKEDLVQQVWRMKVYRPERHDALVHTAASRLRNTLGVHAAWITIGEHGYGLAEGVTVEDDRTIESIAPHAPGAPPKAKGGDARRDLLLAELDKSESLSTSEVASLLKVSEMTAFRLLSALVSEGAVERSGQGKRTRYRRPA